MLTRLKVEPADESVAEAWLRTYAARPLREYECDAGPVAAAVLDGPYEALDGPDKAPGGKSLTVIVRYTNDDEQTVSRLARRLVKGRAIDAGGVRHIAAAVRLAYDRDRGGYAENNAAKISRDKIASFPWDGFRRKADQDTLPASVRSERDEQAGRRLSELMGRVAESDESGRS